MKKYMSCLLLFLVVSGICASVGYVVTNKPKEEVVTGVPATQFQSETVVEDYAVANQKPMSYELETVGEEYYLVSEDGFLLVFLKDKKTICLYTHISIMDFPETERTRLREGIWFHSMMDVFNYLESYTS